MKTELNESQRREIAKELLPLVNGAFRELYSPKRIEPMTSMIHRPWISTMISEKKQWKAQSGLKSITISELMELSDNELIELKEKIDKAKAIKGVKTKQTRYDSR